MTVLRTFQEWPERDFRQLRDGLPIVTARDGAGMRFSADEDTTRRRNGFGQSAESMEAEGRCRQAFLRRVFSEPFGNTAKSLKKECSGLQNTISALS